MARVELGSKDYDFIGRINRARRDNTALQKDWSLRFFAVDNEQLICYAKTSADLDNIVDNIVVVVVNLDPAHTQSGWVDIDLAALEIFKTVVEQGGITKAAMRLHRVHASSREFTRIW